MEKAKCIQGLTWGCYTCRTMWKTRQAIHCNNCMGLRNCPISNAYDEAKPKCDGCRWEPEKGGKMYESQTIMHCQHYSIGDHRSPIL